MNKFTVLFILIPFLLAEYIYAQSGSDPLHWTAPIPVKSNNIFLLWSQQNAGGSTLISHQKIYRYYTGNKNMPSTQRLSGTRVHQDSTAFVNGNDQMDVAAGYFTHGVLENAVAVWEGPNQTIQVMIPHFDTTANAWSKSSEMTIPGPVVAYGAQQRGRIYVRTGDFLGNGLDQFVIAYQGADSTIHLQVYQVNDSLEPQLIASINDEKLLPTPTGYARFSITTGDLNGDGKDEIILDGMEQNYDGHGNWAIYTKVYEVSGSSIIPESRRIIFEAPTNYSIQAPEFGITAGQFKENGEHQIAFVCAANQYDGNNAYVYIYMLEASKDLSTLTYDISKRDSIQIGTSGSLTDFSIASGDLNGDSRDELVYDLSGIMYVYSTDDSLNVSYRLTLGGLSSGPEDDQLSYDFVKVGDLNNDSYDDVVQVKDVYGNGTNHWLQMVAFTVSKDLSSDSLLAVVSTDTSVDNGASSYYHYAMALGTFNGSCFTLGGPKHFVENNIVQPLVILNTPPIHFDILNGTKYDLSNCFNGNSCSFYSTYEQLTSTSINLESQTHNDVSDAAGVDLSGSVTVGTQDGINLGAEATISVSVAANFELKLEKTWGNSYSSEKSSTQTTSLDIGVSAMGDDQIYSTTSSFDLWIYPVYDGNNPNPVDYINFASPIRTLGSWSPSKTYATNNYIPNHEVGNILSYLPSDSAIYNPNIDSSIVSVSQSQGLPISGQSGSYWDLNYSKYSQSSLDSTWNSGWDVNINVVGAYSSKGNNSHMTTNTTTIMNGFDLRATFGSLVDSLGNEAAYTVYPYAYRSKEGAVVIDYAVDPVIGGPNSPSWWQNEYGKYSDPTFILPWFYDPAKGISLSFSAKRYQTTDIFFSNNAPQVGDTINITARVRNFSLAATPAPVTVKFYVGDPDSGGTIITGINGIDSTTTKSYIKSRRWSDASIKWIVPPGLQQYPRIYAVVDPSNQIKEVHENNNKGFSILGNNSITGIIHASRMTIPNSPILYQSFPNPFNPTARIEYSIPKTALVKLIVYNILGQKVKTLFNGEEGPGKYSVTYNGDHLASGVYFYRLQAGNYVNTKKMVLLK